jgi:hypothetical protein
MRRFKVVDGVCLITKFCKSDRALLLVVVSSFETIRSSKSEVTRSTSLSIGDRDLGRSDDGLN